MERLPPQTLSNRLHIVVEVASTKFHSLNTKEQLTQRKTPLIAHLPDKPLKELLM
jgi:hypothetical protein